MDVRTGGIVAMASYPTYDPNIWVGGISSKDYKSITSKKNNYPQPVARLPGRVRAGSTFKVVSLPAAVQGRLLAATAPTTARRRTRSAARRRRNFESQALRRRSRLRRAIEVSCDTVFYKFAYETWLREGGLHPKKNAKDPFTEMAKAFGLGKPTGLDLPERGRRPDRRPGLEEGVLEGHQGLLLRARPRPATRRCAQDRPAARGVPAAAVQGELRRRLGLPRRRRGQLRHRPGRHAVTPLQMARVYAAVANGGTLVTPHIGKAIITPDGQAGPPDRARSRPAGCRSAATTLTWLRHALRGVTEARHRLRAVLPGRLPADKLPVAAKTGTGEVYGKQTTSWFASFAPANKPQYAVVMMVSQGGTGSGISGPVGRRALQDAVRRQRAARSTSPTASPPGGHPTTALPDGAARTAPSSHAGAAGSRPPTGCRPRRPTLPGRTGATTAVAADEPSATAPRRTPCRPRGAAARLLHRDVALRRLDWPLLLAVLALCAIGGALVWSATRQAALDSGGDPTAFLKKHMPQPRDRPGARRRARRCSTTGCCGRTRRSSTSLSIAGLVAVLSPLGSTINGSHSWIVLPAGFSVQPSEFAKVALVVGMAMLLSEKRDAEDDPARRRRRAGAGVRRRTARRWSCCSPTSAPRWSSSAIVLGVVAVVRRPAALGRRAGRSAPCWSPFVAVQAGLLKDYQLDRFRAFADPTADPQGVGYNVRQARIAIGSGGVRRPGAVPRRPDPGPVRPRAADRLRLHRRGGGARLRRRRR